MFRIQVYLSGCFLNTTHESEDIEALKALLKDESFAGPRYRIVDHEGTVQYGPVVAESNEAISVEDVARAFGVPVMDPRILGFVKEANSDKTDEAGIGYTLQAIHEHDGSTIISLELQEAQAEEIMNELWSNVDFWAAPGGASMQVENQSEAETINRVLGNYWIVFQPELHRWLFHVHLI